MATLESATERLEEALKRLEKLEGEVDRAAQSRPEASGNGADDPDGESLESLRQHYDEMKSAYEAMRARYENMREKNQRLAARLAETIARLRRLDGS